MKINLTKADRELLEYAKSKMQKISDDIGKRIDEHFERYRLESCTVLQERKMILPYRRVLPGVYEIGEESFADDGFTLTRLPQYTAEHLWSIGYATLVYCNGDKRGKRDLRVDRADRRPLTVEVFNHGNCD